MNSLTIKNWKLTVHEGPLPDPYSTYARHASYVDDIDTEETQGIPLFVSVSSDASSTPDLISTQRYKPGNGLSVGCLLVPEKAHLFIGAGEKIVCYDVAASKRLWIETTPHGFWRWVQIDDYIIMSAEIEFAVWNTVGEKLWSTFVEPPWTFTASKWVIKFDIMGKKQYRKLADGKVIETLDTLF
jgi:hypothetical protein